MELANLGKGIKARVISIDNDVLAPKLYEMGLLPGQIIELQGSAPFGCPLLVKVSGYLLSLRREEAVFEKVQVD